jgi:membrane associated rhomboid family serine protease
VPGPGLSLAALGEISPLFGMYWFVWASLADWLLNLVVRWLRLIAGFSPSKLDLTL